MKDEIAWVTRDRYEDIIKLLFKMCRSRWPRGQSCGSAAACLLGLWVRVPPGPWMSVSCECCLLSGKGLCVWLIIRTGESYRV